MPDSDELERSATTTLLPGPIDEHEPTDLRAGLAHLRALLERQDLAGARTWVDRLRRLWPDSDRVQHFSRILARPAVVSKRGPLRRSRSQEYGWLREHAAEYPGCWLAVLGENLVAVDPDFSVVLAAVKKLERSEEVLLHFQPSRPQ